MNRKETTAFLGQLLVREKFGGIGKYWSKEVCIDFGTRDVKRIDYMQFQPANQVEISGIESGIFICYEVKSCKADFESGFGQNFIGEKNYFVMPMSLYKDVVNQIPHHVGVLVPIPLYVDKLDEFESPTPLNAEDAWRLIAVKPALTRGRKKSMVELLFCMLRSSRNQ